MEWEVYYFHEDAEFNDPRYEQEYQAATSTQCCLAPAAAEAPQALLPIALPAEAAACTPGAGCC